MKRFLLCVITMLCAVTGAWANVTLSDSNPYLVLTTTAAGDVDSGWSGIQWPNYTNERVGLKIVGPVNAVDITKLADFSQTLSTEDGIIDFSGATLDGSVAISQLSSKFKILRVPTSYSLMDNALPASISFAFSTDATRQRYWAGDEENNVLNISVNSDGLAKAKTFFTTDTYNYNGFLNYRTINLMGAFSSSELSTFISGFDSGTEPIIKRFYTLPVNIDGCNVVINLDKSEKSLSELLEEANATLSSTAICDFTVLGSMTKDDISGLNTAMGASNALSNITRLNLGASTGFDQNDVNALAIPTSIISLVLPSGMEIAGDLLAKGNGDSYSALQYIYSPTSNNQTQAEQFVADRVWVAQSGGLELAFKNEEKLCSGIYVRVETKKYNDENHSNRIQLNDGDVDFTSDNIGREVKYQYLDASKSYITLENAAKFKAPHSSSYRVILPDGTTGNQLAAFASNNNVLSCAAAYSYEGTTLNILEITDATYSPAALHDSRIVRSGTTALVVETGNAGLGSKGVFGSNLLAAINNAYNGGVGVGQDITSVTISTNTCPDDLTFSNTHLQTIAIEDVRGNTNAALNVTACAGLQELNLEHSTLASVAANNLQSLVTVNMKGTTVSGATNLSGNTLMTTLTTNSNTNFGGELNLTGNTNDGFTSFSTEAKVGGDIKLNGCTNLTSVDVSSAQFQNTTSKVHVDSGNGEGDDVITKLQSANSIKVPTGFASSTRVHPYVASYIEEKVAEVAQVTESATTMHLHTLADNDGDNYVYWYEGVSQEKKDINVTTSSSTSFTSLVGTTDGKFNTGGSYVRVKIAGPLTVSDINTYLHRIDTQVLDLSEATSGENNKTIGEMLKAKFNDDEGGTVHTNVRYIILPDTCSREYIVNASALSKLTNVYCVIATEDTNDGPNITSYNRVAGTLQAATVMVFPSSSAVWSRNSKDLYTTNHRQSFGIVRLSGVLNAFDLAKGSQGLALSADGHLEWNETVIEGPESAQERTLKTGNIAVYGTFSTCNVIYEIDLEKATFQEGFVSDMTLSYLGIVAALTRKIVIPTDASVKEIPADFMRDVTHIRAICIPSNIEIIRTRAFKSIDYVWTTSHDGDPEGINTKLDNGVQYGTLESPSAVYYGSQDANFDYTMTAFAGTYTIGANVKLIETAAFANTQPHVKDVYVLNKVAPECHVDAFNTVMYLGNGGYAPDIKDGIITRDSYINQNYWITMLHYPRQTVTPNLQRYTDPTRQYSIATGERDGKGATLYYPNQSEFIRAYAQGQNGYIWNAWDPTRQFGSVDNGEFSNVTLDPYSSVNQGKANNNYTNYTAGGDNHQFTSFYDVTVNESKPDLVDYYKVNWNEGKKSYSEAKESGNLYPLRNTENPEIGEVTERDYRGWHQFVLNAYAANTTLNSEPYHSYITDNEWWTICPTFDITRAAAIQMFGVPDTDPTKQQIPFVSKLMYVTRDYDTEHITLNFSKNLMTNKENRTNPTDQHGTSDDNGVLSISDDAPGDDDVVMSAGVPYLIKPYMPDGNIRMYQVFRDQVECDKIIAQYSGQDQSTIPFKWIVNEKLYDAMIAANGKTGAEQIEMVEGGVYSVPVFVKGGSTEATDGNTYTIGGESYNKSTAWKYSFVGTFYKSFMPRYCYFLGWDNGTNSARFYYNDEPDSHTMRWTNETGIICPTEQNFTYTIFRATSGSQGEPAQWKLSLSAGDDLTLANSSRVNTNYMLFDAPDVIAGQSTGVVDNVSKSVIPSNFDSVIGLDGLKRNSQIGLRKGIYIKNGKKIVVK